MKALRLPSHLAAALLLAAAFVVGAWWAATPAAAHDQLISSTPADGGTLTELPTQIVLEFNNELIDAAPALLIRDAANTTIHRATPEVDGRFATTAFPELGDGSYRIAWSVVSSDGHRIEGSMPFEMATGRAAAPWRARTRRPRVRRPRVRTAARTTTWRRCPRRRPRRPGSPACLPPRGWRSASAGSVRWRRWPPLSCSVRGEVG